MGAALAWAVFRTRYGDRDATLVATAAVLFLPFVLVAANRELSLRDAAPFLYTGIVALGCAASWLVAWGASLARLHRAPLFGPAGALVVTAALFAIAAQGFGRTAQATPTSFDADWDNVIASDTARWLEENVPPGTPIMSTRVYYSHVYFLTGGRYPVHQVPTVLVDAGLQREQPLSARSTLFRWKPLPERTRDTWLYLARYTTKSYYIGLAEEDLLADLGEQRTEYVVVNAPDIGFSSPALLRYFDAHPAFRRVYERDYGERDVSVIYAVDQEQLRPVGAPARVTQAAYDGLIGRAGGDLALVEGALGRLSPAGFELVPR
jgi:hypothetical protein